MSINFKANLTLLLLGIAGIGSILLSTFPIDVPSEVLERFSYSSLRLLSLLNPLILLSFAVFVGGSLAPKISLHAPLIEGILKGKSIKPVFKEQLISGVLFGIITGIVILILSSISEPYLPASFIEKSKEVTLSPITRFLYGGITEEIMLRWGMMTLFVWFIWKLQGEKTSPPSSTIYWIGIVIAAFLFGLGHLPVVFNLASDISGFLIIYIIGANMIFGLVAGWLFWKKGIEAAIFAHMVNHVIFLLAGYFIS